MGELEPNDAPWLFKYLRENFYSAVESGHLDLYAEFLDNFRQYGCTSLDDQQTVDGTLVLLEGFHQAKGRWMDYRDPDDDAKLGTYDIMHKAWTAYVGLHQRMIETPPPGISYLQEARQAVAMALRKVEARHQATEAASNPRVSAKNFGFLAAKPCFVNAHLLILDRVLW